MVCVFDVCLLATVTALVTFVLAIVNEVAVCLSGVFPGCCEREVLYPACRRLCSLDSLLSHIDDPDIAFCLYYIRNIIGCATGM